MVIGQAWRFTRVHLARICLEAVKRCRNLLKIHHTVVVLYMVASSVTRQPSELFDNAPMVVMLDQYLRLRLDAR